MKRFAIIASAALFAASAAQAGDEKMDFASLDADGSGGLSAEEVKAAAPEATEQEFAQYDADGSGELSEPEFTAWLDGKAA